MSDSITVKDIKDKVDGKEMDLSLMQISKIPVKEMSTFKKVNSVDLSCNQIEILPDNFFSTLKYLVKLDLSKNRIQEIPGDIYRLELLQHLDLYNNKIEDLPVSMSRLKNLKWLDLKDNPLNSVLVKVVGGCLDDKECRKCANSVVTYYKNMSSDMERIRQQELKREREKQALIRKAEEEEERKIQMERKRKKQLEKEERRKLWNEKEKEKESRKRKRADESSDEDRAIPERSNEASANSSSWFFTFWGVLIMCFFAVIFSAIGVRLYCQENPTNDECIIVKDWTENYRQASNDHFKAAFDHVKYVLQLGFAKMSQFIEDFGF